MIRTQFYREYKLLKDTHALKAGTKILFDPFGMKYADTNYGEAKQTFTLADTDNREWFEPIGDAQEFYPLVKPEDIGEHIELHPETRHNDMCDWCRAFQKIANTGYIEEKYAELIVSLYNTWREQWIAGDEQHESKY